MTKVSVKFPLIQELDTVALTHDIKEHRLKKGDLGAVVHCYNGSETEESAAFEVEFVDDRGRTVALLQLLLDDIELAPVVSRKKHTQA